MKNILKRTAGFLTAVLIYLSAFNLLAEENSSVIRVYDLHVLGKSFLNSGSTQFVLQIDNQFWRIRELAPHSPERRSPEDPFPFRAESAEDIQNIYDLSGGRILNTHFPSARKIPYASLKAQDLGTSNIQESIELLKREQRISFNPHDLNYNQQTSPPKVSPRERAKQVGVVAIGSGLFVGGAMACMYAILNLIP